METQALLVALMMLYSIGGIAPFVAVVVLTLVICLLIILFVSKDD